MSSEVRLPGASTVDSHEQNLATLMASAVEEERSTGQRTVLGKPELTAPAQATVEAKPLTARGVLHHVRTASSLSARFVLVLLVVYGLLFNFSVVRGSSMSPSIFDGDRILIDHFTYLFTEVGRGDIVVLQYPLDPRLDYIKRVIGVPGDEVVIEKGRVFVNGEELQEQYVDVPDLSSRLQTYVMKGHYFVLGDNRCHSSDSREFGQVPVENLRGKVDLRVWPLGRIGLIQ